MPGLTVLCRFIENFCRGRSCFCRAVHRVLITAEICRWHCCFRWNEFLRIMLPPAYAGNGRAGMYRHRNQNIIWCRKTIAGKKEFRLKPDIVMRHHGKLCILDTKWKQLDDKYNHCGISQADLYQMFAYGKKYQKEEKIKHNSLPSLSLQPGQFTESISFHYDDDLQLICAPVNLVNDKASILAAADMPPIRAVAA